MTEKTPPDPFLAPWWQRIAFILWMVFVLAAVCGWIADYFA